MAEVELMILLQVINPRSQRVHHRRNDHRKAFFLVALAILSHQTDFSHDNDQLALNRQDRFG